MPTQINIFVSSKMDELHEEREELRKFLPTLDYGRIKLHAWIFEQAATAEDRSIQKVYLEALKNSALYLGLFWNIYGEWTIDEFNHATLWGIDRHIYVKDVNAKARAPRLQEFLNKQSNVPLGITSKWFRSLDDLRQGVSASINKWISSRLRRTAASGAIIATRPDHIPNRAEVFIGHERLLEQVLVLIGRHQQILLQGFSGTGKTALAVEAAARYLEGQPDRAVLWFKAGKRSDSEVQIALGEALGQGDRILEKQADEKIAAVRELLARSGEMLLILDDAQDGKTLRAVLPAIPPNVALLVTSNQRHGMIRNILEVEPLDPVAEPDAALRVLRHYSGVNWDDEDARKLCHMLGYLPFALRIAGCKMREEKSRPAQLIKRYEDHPDNMRWESAEEGRESVAVLLDTLLEDLDPDARRVFEAFGALYAPHATAELITLYLQPAMTDGQIEEQLGVLVRFGLADSDPESDLPFYIIHDLAYTYARGRQANTDRRLMI